MGSGNVVGRSTMAGALVALAALVLPAGAGAAPPASPWAATDHGAVRLVAAAEAVGEAKTASLGLHFRMNEGWKIYWRSPGDAGFPPRIKWAGSDNLAGATMAWPAPMRFSILGFETLGYENEVVLPITATLSRPGEPLRLRAHVEYLTCKEICIPYEASLALDLPSGTANPSPFAHLINRYEVQVPGDGSAHGLAIERVEEVAGESVVRVTAQAKWPFKAPDVYLEGPAEVQFGPPKVQLQEGGKRAVLEVPVHGLKDLKGGLAGHRLTVTLVDGSRSAERTLAVMAVVGPAAAVAAAAHVAEAISLPFILALALLGGLILNLMPCVLPVLSIKLLGVVGHGGRERRAVRVHFVASAAGILFAFLVLAGALVALKSAGLAVGWGIQFQHPWFLIAMTLVVTLFACNLWGFFEIRLPEWLADMGGGSEVHGLGGHFLAGAFATLLATPCSAPFLGTAVGFALSRQPLDIMAVFAVLGVGMALPYLLIAAFPGLAARLPRPGFWMVVLRRILGFALAGTAVWLLSVLSAQVGSMASATVGILMAAIAIVLYLRSRPDQRLGRIAGMAVVVFAVLAFPVPAWLSSAKPPVPSDPAAGLWKPFNEAAIPGLVAGGSVVFVDVTADWCITCQVNKAFVLTKGEVIKQLSADGVVSMQADWTNPDDAISRYLARFGRYGIPFNAVYGPGAPQGITLPELLTEKAVLSALQRARGDAVASTR